MIVFGLCIGSDEKAAAFALPSLERIAEPGSEVLQVRGADSIFTAYNAILDALAGRDDVEALVLLHEDVEIRDPGFCAKARAALAEPGVGIVGAIGARNVRSLAWWEGEGRGRADETRGLVDFGGGTHDVDSVDGLLLVLSPWAIENLRFDEERFSGFHGYDADLCFQARQAGRRVLVAELDLFHHTKGGYGDEVAYRAADAAFRAKWFAAADAPLTSIVVLTLNGLAHTEGCLASIARFTPEPHEVIVVDNGSTDGTLEFLRVWAERTPNARVIVNDENRGFAGGNNQGLAVARGDVVCLLNNDTVVTAGWLRALTGVLDREPSVGLVGPVSNYVNGPQLVEEVPYTSTDELFDFAAAHAHDHAGRTAVTPRLVGFCLLARREVIDRIGGLDERFGVGNFEDDDFCVRALIAGFDCRIALDSFVHHAGSATFRANDVDYKALIERNWGIFCEKWNLPSAGPPGIFDFGPEMLEGLERLDCPLADLSGLTPSLDGRWLSAPERADAAGRLVRLVDEVARAGRTGDAAGIAAAFAEIAGSQARRQLAETVLATPVEAPWPVAFAAAAQALLDALETGPVEPLLLNYAGVFLYELGEHAVARPLFEAALELDPDLDHARANLEAAERVLATNMAQRPFAAVGDALAPRIRRVVEAASPAAEPELRPEQLVVMLYDGAIRFLGEAAAAMRAADRERANERIGRAGAILGELDRSLDLSYGDLPRRLRSIYGLCKGHLAEAAERSDAAPLERVGGLLGELRQAWDAAAAPAALAA